MQRREMLAASITSPLLLTPGEKWHQNFYISEKLYRRSGYEPLEIAEREVSRAFDKAGIDHEINVYCDPIEFENSDSACGDQFDEWNSRDLNGDSNVCLTAAQSGGCGTVGGNMALTAARNVIEAEPNKWVRAGWAGVQIHTILHEIAHNAGYFHADRLGRAWEENGLINVTPATSTIIKAGRSVCGHHVPEIEASNRVFHNYYSDCTIALFEKELGSSEPVAEVRHCD